MKKTAALLLALLLCLSLFSGCGAHEDEDEATDAEKNVAAASTRTMPAVDPALITDDDYQIFGVDASTTVFKISGIFSQRFPLVTPDGDSLTFLFQLTNSSKYADEYTIALWQSDGTSMTYVGSYYIPADGGTYECTFTGLSAQTYRPVLSVDAGDATGYLAIEGGHTGAVSTPENPDEEAE
ncbi:MAG: hypothetical protein Q4G07_11735 [Oscillospiraceae bacterium]|nr:hypothetical protein [Oscillospiraceae bacterium]